MSPRSAVSATAITLAISGLLTACGGNRNSGGTAITQCNQTTANPLIEGNIGEFSDDNSAPTPWTLGPGVNLLKAGTSGEQPDYVSFTVGNCETLDTITVDAYSTLGNDLIAFMAIQSGATFTVTPETASTRIGELLGYSHFGLANVGQDMLAPMGAQADAIGFTSPLPAGTYTMWLNQLGVSSEYTLVFNVSRVEP